MYRDAVYMHYICIIYNNICVCVSVNRGDWAGHKLTTEMGKWLQ